MGCCGALRGRCRGPGGARGGGGWRRGPQGGPRTAQGANGGLRGRDSAGPRGGFGLAVAGPRSPPVPCWCVKSVLFRRCVRGVSRGSPAVRASRRLQEDGR
ncbi:MAG: hypothetical protein FJ290_06655 [Planctomycetes bacterium]|nr:hypothetical protein [Planctomycetota bacterium]